LDWRLRGPGTCLDNEKNRKILDLSGLKLCPLSHPACTQLLYRLHYPGSQGEEILKISADKICYVTTVNLYGTAEDYTMRIFTICTLQLVLFGWTNEVEMSAIKSTERHINLRVW
jgi:hypothetical protein